MSSHHHDSDHSHHHHDLDHSHCCSLGEDYELNIEEQRKQGLTRRQALTALGASGLLIAGGAISAGPAFAATTQTFQNYQPQGSDDFDGFFYISGDHHIHTRYSPDAKYAVQRQVAEANYHGLGWMVITDHGGAAHNKLSVDLTYPDVVRAREAFPNMLVFTGLEMNIPGGEHGTVMVEPTTQERDQIKQFELMYDGAIVLNSEETALAGLRYLDGLSPKPLFFANHPARRGLDSPHEIRNWKSAAPDVAYGFEGAPGHQAAGLIRDKDGKFIAYRGFYGNTAEAGAFPGYPPESYFTYGGFDWMTAKLGGLWDSLLGDGLRWWITANSDSHKYYNDLQDVDNTNYNTVGYVSEADRYFQRPTYGDFRPGEYSRTYAIVKEQSYGAIMGALRGGKSFVVQGDLIDRLKFTAAAGRSHQGVEVSLGDTLNAKKGDDVTVTIKVRVPSAPNWNKARPNVDHVDLIAGDINYLSKQAGLDNQNNPSTHVVRTFGKHDWHEKWEQGGLVLTMEHVFRRVDHDFYIRLRGTNTDDRRPTPKMDPDMRGQTGAGESPWDDLWFYCNPIFVQVK
ncbi:PHP domain-containing protein [Ktedonobacter racemifer]|uniref:PHP domain protein n=1 Tax=Ktedonobacter racemifer DSM 44963 TaxID=485913 RepID=D6TSV8_KTERA|nr:PHP domain-containing protein [Ktedonobacter racemifer]EFH83509.1 PHP domain protein [Ktedonobacter racemifer DSM 44963]